jgi:hypothetical protein
LQCTTLAYLLTYLRSWDREELPIVQPLKNSPAFYVTRRFNIVFTRALYWSISGAISIQSTPSHPISLRCTKSHVHFLLRSFIPGIRPGPRLLVYFCNMLLLYGEELLAPRPTPKLEDHPLSAVLDWFNIFAAAIKLEAFSSIRNLRTRHAVVTRDPPNMEYYNIKILKYCRCYMFRLHEAIFRHLFEGLPLLLFFVFLFSAFLVTFFGMRLFVFCSVLPICVCVQAVLVYSVF